MNNLSQTPNIDKLAQDEQSPDKSYKTQATTLVSFCKDAELFHSPDGTSFATYEVNCHRETAPVRSKRFRDWLTKQYYQELKRAPGKQPLQDALALIDAKALHDGNEIPVFTRVGRIDDTLYVDLGNPKWEVVEIKKDGWKIVSNPPIKFWRPKTMAALPRPTRTSCLEGINKLRQFLNVANEDDLMLTVGWMICAFHPTGPYPVLALCGEQGTAKSSTARALRSLVDPNSAPLRAIPRREEDLMVSAKNGWVIALDNVSKVPDWLSDALCRVSTGGGLSKRELYTNDDEIVIDVKRPIIMTGIEDFVARGDLQERSVVINPPVISNTDRKTEAEMKVAFEKESPEILGGIMEALVESMKTEGRTKLDSMPRMADAVLWVTGAESALGLQPKAFSQMFADNQRRSSRTVLEGSPLVAQIRELATDEGGWEGTASELWTTLSEQLKNDHQALKSFPDSPRKLSGILRRIAPNLRSEKIIVEWPPGSRTKHGALIKISMEPKNTPPPETTTDGEGDECGW